MSKTKSAGASRLGRDSTAKRLGVKLFGGEIAKPGSIIIRQRGTKFHPGLNVKRGNDDTLYAIKSGVINFSIKKRKSFNGKSQKIKLVNVIPN